MTQPAMGGMQSPAMTGPFLWILVAIHEPPTVATSWTKPKGMLKRMVWKESKPKDLMIRGPNVEIPPDGILPGISPCDSLQTRESHLRDGKDEGKPAPSLDIQYALLEMIPAPLAGHDTLLVHSETLNCDELIVVVEELGFDGRIGHEEEHDNGEDHSDDTEEDEDDLSILVSILGV